MNLSPSKFHHQLLIAILVTSHCVQAKEWNSKFTLVRFRKGEKLTEKHKCVWLQKLQYQKRRNVCRTGINAVNDHASVVCPLTCKQFSLTKCDKTICESRATFMKFQFTGGSCEDSIHTQEDKFFCEDHRNPTVYPVRVIMRESGSKAKKDDENDSGTYFDGLVHEEGEVFTIGNGNRVSADMDVEIWNKYGTILQKFTYHSSCSKNLFLGDIFGSVKLVGFQNEDQGKVMGCYSSKAPTLPPTFKPTFKPTPKPTKPQTVKTRRPRPNPTPRPTPRPTRRPTPRPTPRPKTRRPTRSPTSEPTSPPTSTPTSTPTKSPTKCAQPLSNDKQNTPDPCTDAPSAAPSNSCFEKDNAQFVRSVKRSNGQKTFIYKTCKWLRNQDDNMRTKFCKMNSKNFDVASQACMITCGICIPESTDRKFLRKLDGRREIIQKSS